MAAPSDSLLLGHSKVKKILPASWAFRRTFYEARDREAVWRDGLREKGVLPFRGHLG